MKEILTEITPLSDKDFFYLSERHKPTFNYPLHRHVELELNFVGNCQGSHRVVGDSVEVLGDFDLAIIGSGIEHGWMQGECTSPDIHEITIQFSPTLMGDSLFLKTQMLPIYEMLNSARMGLAFDMPAIMSVYGKLKELPRLESGFSRVIAFLDILHTLAEQPGRHVLATSSFAEMAPTSESRRVRKVQEYIVANYDKTITLDYLASLVSMTPSSFSRFFKQRTGCNISDYIIDTRIGHAVRELIDTTTSIAEICFICGFNNISNFNRLFKRKKGLTPKEFREYYRKHRILV